MILVLGATGQNGRGVVKELAARGARVRAGARSVGAPAAGAAESVAFDYGDRQSIRRALDGVERVFLVSPSPSMEAGVVEEAARAGVERIVKLSVIAADEESYTFGRWHREIERKIEAAGIPHAFLRPTGFVQNLVNYHASSIKAQGAFYAAAGDARIAHVDVRDNAAVAAELLLGGDELLGRGYELTGPEGVTYTQIAGWIGEAAGKDVRYLNPGDEGLKKGLIGIGTPEAYADALVDLDRFYRTGRSATPSPWIETLTGRPPRSVPAFIQENAEAFR